MPTTPGRWVQFFTPGPIPWVSQELQSCSPFLISELLLNAPFHFSPHPHLPAPVLMPTSCLETRHAPVSIRVAPNPFSFPWLSIRGESEGTKRIRGFLLSLF